MSQAEMKHRKKLIRIKMIEKELTTAEISRRLNVPYSTIGMVLSLKRRTPWLREVIARILESTVEELFGASQEAA